MEKLLNLIYAYNEIYTFFGGFVHYGIPVFIMITCFGVIPLGISMFFWYRATHNTKAWKFLAVIWATILSVTMICYINNLSAKDANEKQKIETKITNYSKVHPSLEVINNKYIVDNSVKIDSKIDPIAKIEDDTLVILKNKETITVHKVQKYNTKKYLNKLLHQ